MEEQNIVKQLRWCSQNNDFAFANTVMVTAASEIELLRKQLSESQRREQTAVEDMQLLHTLCMEIGGCCPECGCQIDELLDPACDVCKKSGMKGCWVKTPENESKCAGFDWCGVRVEKGESE